MKRIFCAAVLGLVTSMAAGAQAEQRGVVPPAAAHGAVARPVVARAAAPRPAAAPRVGYRRLSDIAAAKPGVIVRAATPEDIAHIARTKREIAGDVFQGGQSEARNDFNSAGWYFGRGAATHAELAAFYKQKGVEAFRAGDNEAAGNFFAHALHAYADAMDTWVKQADAAHIGGLKAMQGEAVTSAKAAQKQAHALEQKLGWDSEHPTVNRLTQANTNVREASYMFEHPN